MFDDIVLDHSISEVACNSSTHPALIIVNGYEQGWLTSPNYPAYYENLMNCQWLIGTTRPYTVTAKSNWLNKYSLLKSLTYFVRGKTAYKATQLYSDKQTFADHNTNCWGNPDPLLLLKATLRLNSKFIQINLPCTIRLQLAFLRLWRRRRSLNFIAENRCQRE